MLLEVSLIELRAFTESDYPAARTLWAQTDGVGLSRADEPEAIARFLRRNPGLSFVASDGTAIVGTILCGQDGRRGLIHHLVVTPTLRRAGTGRALLQAGLAALAREGIDKCHLLVFRDNADGLAFWRRVKASERTELLLFSIETGRDG